MPFILPKPLTNTTRPCTIEFDSIDWHKTSLVDIQKRLEVDATTGLDPGHAAARLKKHGPNKLSPPPNPWVWKILGYFFKGFGSILLVGGILVFVSWKPLGEPAPAVANLALGIVLIAVFIIQAGFNAWQDWSSSRVMESITAMLPEASHVIRNGNEMELSSLDIVPGDVLLLKAGNKIPADVRYLEVSHDMSVDRAVLTGKPQSSLAIILVDEGASLTRTFPKKVNPSQSEPPPTPPTITTSKRAASASKGHTASRAQLPASLSLRATRLFLDKLPSSRVPQRPASQPSRKKSSALLGLSQLSWSAGSLSSPPSGK